MKRKPKDGMMITGMSDLDFLCYGFMFLYGGGLIGGFIIFGFLLGIEDWFHWSAPAAALAWIGFLIFYGRGKRAKRSRNV